jgi:hypothetical protein
MRFAAVAAILGAIAWASPRPDRVTDRGIYEATTAHTVVPDCSDLQCFRVLVPWVLGSLPGSSDLRWKTYAVISNATAATLMLPLCLAFGLGRRAAMLASAMSAVGFGSLYTLHDPYTSDPLMFALGPLLTLQLLSGRLVMAGVIAVIGVIAKEFAAVPLYAYAGYAAIERRWGLALRAALAGNFAFLTWVVLTVTLMLRYNYTWGQSGVGSANIVGGAALAMWLRGLTLRGIITAMFNEFTVLYVLVPAGVFMAPSSLRRLAVVSLPIAALFCVVQQPDRALWNFHYLIVPFGAIVLARVPAPLAWSTIALFAIGNLRVGAQLPIAGIAHLAIAAAMLLGVSSVVIAWRGVATGGDPEGAGRQVAIS